MRTFSMFQVDAFAERLFLGNPAAVLILDDWLDDSLMQAIAAENNLPETAFARPADSGYQLRWFTPLQEVDFCGHATLATAHVLATAYGVTGGISFSTKSVGILRVHSGEPGFYTLDFPSLPPAPVAAPPHNLIALFPDGWDDVLRRSENFYVVVRSAAAVRDYTPDFAGILALAGLSLCITAADDAGGVADFVSRYFAPGAGISEDPVTGSIHASLTPYWAGRLGRHSLRAVQASRRGGRLDCTLAGDRVLITGQAITYMEARITIPAAR